MTDHACVRDQGVGEPRAASKPVPEPGPEEAIVRTTAELICTSDYVTLRNRVRRPFDVHSAYRASA